MPLCAIIVRSSPMGNGWHPARLTAECVAILAWNRAGDLGHWPRIVRNVSIASLADIVRCVIMRVRVAIAQPNPSGLLLQATSRSRSSGVVPGGHAAMMHISGTYPFVDTLHKGRIRFAAVVSIGVEMAPCKGARLHIAIG